MFDHREGRPGDPNKIERRLPPAPALGPAPMTLDARSALIAGDDDALRRLTVVAFIRFFPTCNEG